MSKFRHCFSVLFLLVAVSLSGCITMPPGPQGAFGRAISESNAKVSLSPVSGYGAIVASIGSLKEFRGMEHSFVVRNAATGAIFSLHHQAQKLLMPSYHDINTPEIVATVVAIYVPPGTYVLENFSTKITGEATYWAREPFNFKFVVTPSETSYLGEFIGSRNRDVFLGMSFAKGIHFYFSDKQSRDLEIASQKQGSGYFEKINVQLLTTEIKSHPLIRSQK